MKNYIEQDAAATEIGQPFDLAAKRQKVFEVADQRGLPRDLIGTGYVSTTAVKYAQTHSAARVLFVWQLCSGFAHGRPWAYLGASEREECATADPSVQHVRMTSSYGTTLLPALNAVHLLEDVLRNYNLRSGGTFGAVR
ncbi:hypothetical protein LZP97_26450 (plasmid) [Rhodococcus sp. DMF-1]|uniref:hypothetical protein n=1 Tax=Rhodococcus sp. DMF-1 TaxID=2907624 RepID=UPI001F324CA2|nr:hypothetical protein [Rhodococcus sp. DMF-1]UIR39640.1 hypothetical protein LZP97_26450 [Rhodococcus sp. DMF-1]